MEKQTSDLDKLDPADVDWIDSVESWTTGLLSGFVEKIGLGLMWVAGWIFLMPLMLAGLAVIAIPLAVKDHPEGFNPWPGAIVWWILTVVSVPQLIVAYRLIKGKMAHDLMVKKGDRAASWSFIREAVQRLSVSNVIVRWSCFLWWLIGWGCSFVAVMLYTYNFNVETSGLSYWPAQFVGVIMITQFVFGGNTLFVMAFACIKQSSIPWTRVWFTICLIDGAIVWLIGQRISDVVIHFFQK